jgi:acyl carrier protein
MNTRIEVDQKIIDLIAVKMDGPASQIKHDMKLADDLGMDSLDVFELGMLIEKEFNIVIPDMEFQNVSTVNDVILLVVNKLNPVDGNS